MVLPRYNFSYITRDKITFLTTMIKEEMHIPNPKDYDREGLEEYKELMEQTNALHRDYIPENPNPRSHRSKKWEIVVIVYKNVQTGDGLFYDSSIHLLLLLLRFHVSSSMVYS